MHNICYVIYDEIIKRNNIMNDIQEHAREEGDGYSSKMKWHDDIPPLESEGDARKFIESKDNGWYSDHAVRFYDYSEAYKTKKIEELCNRVKQLTSEEISYREKHSIHNFKASYIGCPKCGSKMNKEYIVGDKCPLCKIDLRAKTTIEKLEWYKNKKQELYEKIEQEKRKQKSKAKVKWLVKYEFHS